MTIYQDVTYGGIEKKLKARQRLYPKFTPGMTVSDYVHDYYRRNALRWAAFSAGIQSGVFTPVNEERRLYIQVQNFFAPLSERPQQAHDDSVIEEALA